jgi:hypothetical protein
MGAITRSAFPAGTAETEKQEHGYANRTRYKRRVVVASDPSRRVMPGDGDRSFPDIARRF